MGRRGFRAKVSLAEPRSVVHRIQGVNSGGLSVSPLGETLALVRHLGDNWLQCIATV